MFFGWTVMNKEDRERLDSFDSKMEELKLLNQRVISKINTYEKRSNTATLLGTISLLLAGYVLIYAIYFQTNNEYFIYAAIIIFIIYIILLGLLLFFNFRK